MGKGHYLSRIGKPSRFAPAGLACEVVGASCRQDIPVAINHAPAATRTMPATAAI